jgi:hypothetical protein
MGKNKKIHKQKVSMRNAMLNNPLARGAVAVASRGKVIDELNRASTQDQIEALNGTVASSNPNKLRRALESKAPGEMDKAIRKFQKEGKPVTVESLTDEIRSTPGFLSMCERVGLTLEWFEQLAKKRMEAHGL